MTKSKFQTTNSSYIRGHLCIRDIIKKSADHDDHLTVFSLPGIDTNVKVWHILFVVLSLGGVRGDPDASRDNGLANIPQATPPSNYSLAAPTKIGGAPANFPAPRRTRRAHRRGFYYSNF